MARKMAVQTNLGADEYRTLQSIADREGTSVAAVIRRMVKRDDEFLAEVRHQELEAARLEMLYS